MRPDLHPGCLRNHLLLQSAYASIDLLEAVRQADGHDHDEDVRKRPAHNRDNVDELRQILDFMQYPVTSPQQNGLRRRRDPMANYTESTRKYDCAQPARNASNDRQPATCNTRSVRAARWPVASSRQNARLQKFVRNPQSWHQQNFHFRCNTCNILKANNNQAPATNRSFVDNRKRDVSYG